MTFPKIIARIRKITWRLLVACMIAMPSALMTAPSTAKADVDKLPPVPIVGLFAAHAARNRVYTTAKTYVDARNVYYDRLRAKAKEQLLAGELVSLRKGQLGAYIKVIELIIREQSAMVQFAETEKKAAHTKFISKVNETLGNVMLSTNAVGRVLGAMQKGLGASRGFINRALDTLSGGGGGVMADIQEVKKVGSYVSLVGEVIGGKTGRDIRSGANRVVTMLGRPTAEIEAGLEQVGEELGELSTRISDLQTARKQPGAGEVAREALISAITGDQVDPAVEAIVQVLGPNRGGGFKERARTALIGHRVARCAAIGDQYRKVLFRLELSTLGVDTLDTMQVPSCSVIDIEELVSGEGGEPTLMRTPVTPTSGRKTATPKPSAAIRTPTPKPPSATRTPTQKATRPVMNSCDFMPPGGKTIENTDRNCYTQFSTEPGRQTVSIYNYDRLDPKLQQNSCQSIANNDDYHTVMSEYPLGVCGYLIDRNFKGSKSLGYKGWSIFFVLDRFSVTVHSNDEYPANKEWVESMAAKIAADIQTYIDTTGN